MTLPLVSVVIPCRNAGRMLRPALESVLGQTWPRLEIIFVDNNSTDGSAAVAQQVLGADARPFVVTECAAQGVNHTRNFGYGLAHGDYIQWLDADDCLDPDKIALQVAALDASPADDIAYGDWSVHWLWAGRPDRTRRHTPTQTNDQVLRTLTGIWYPPHSYLLRRSAAELLQRVQAWWPARGVATDVEYSALAALLGLRFRYVPGAHVHYHVWSDQQLTSAIRQDERIASLRAIFQRLRRFADDSRARVTLTDAHRLLLQQDWTPAALRRDLVTFVRLAQGRFILRRRRDGHRIELDRHEAMIARWLTFTGYAAVPMHQALAIAADVPELSDDTIGIFRAIDRLRREGFLPPIDAADKG
ncbi:MAG TPA: glycosyltransferase family 2 protein [Acetobacteraceae bacterium]|jgi:glycosyltransferase involved in cell wall biosynthesis